MRQTVQAFKPSPEQVHVFGDTERDDPRILKVKKDTYLVKGKTRLWKTEERG